MFDTIVLAGGGPKGLGELGNLHFWHEKGYINNVDLYVGTSIGSVIAMLLSIDYTPEEIFKEILNYSLIDFQNPRIMEMTTKWGLYNMDLFEKKVVSMIKRKLGTILTLSEHYKYTGKHLIIIVHCVDDMDSEFFDYTTEPNLSIVDAIEMSCGIPGLFQKRKYKGKYYVDGGILCNYALSYIEKRFGYSRKILGISISNFDTSSYEDSFFSYGYKIFLAIVKKMQLLDNANLNDKITNIETYFNNVIKNDISEEESTVFLKVLNKIKDSEERNIFNRIVNYELNFDDVSSVNFDLKEEEKKKLFKSGYEQAIKHYNQYCGKKKKYLEEIGTKIKYKDGWEIDIEIP